MRLGLNRWNTLRNQMLVGFMLAMIVILFVVGIVTFDSVSRLLKNNAEKHIQQTAIQANGRLEAVLQQIDSLTTQVATNPYVQQLLLDENEGEAATFSERQALVSSIKLVQTYADGIAAVELYSRQNRRLFPLDEGSLDRKVSQKWIAKARENQGGIVWIGADETEPDTVLAIRSISLIDQWFMPGGYLLVRMNREAFKLDESFSGNEGQETMLVVGPDYSLIAANEEQFPENEIKPLIEAEEPIVSIGEQKYMLVKQQSEVTGWTFLILTPVSEITSGISVLRTAIFVSAGIGTLLFIILSFFLSTIITRPILRLIKTMRGARLGGMKLTRQISSTIEINELNYTYNQMVEHMNELIKLVYEKELLQSRTELKALQAQIHPHFLFNTLEALYWSLQEKQEEELAEYVIAMADLFRYTITGSHKEEWVALAEELEHIERYLLIMTMRMGERMSWSISSLPEFASINIPKLLIQPLVENAVLHGIDNKIGAGEVSVIVSLSHNRQHLIITVEDNGKGMDQTTLNDIHSGLTMGTPSSSNSMGVGITNVYQRLKLYYGVTGPNQPEMSIHSAVDEGTRISMSIPLEVKEGEYA